MEMFTKCGRCGALVETRKTRFPDGTFIYYTPCAAVTEVSSNDMVVRDGCETTVLCPDCMGQLNKWLAGGQTKDLSIAEDIIMDMYAALGAEPQQVQACEYTTARRHEKCSECAFDPTQCVGEMFKNIRWRCAEIGIDLAGDGDDE